MYPTLQAGHVCGDTMDVIDGLPTGSVRVSFGYMSTMDDARALIDFITNTFVKPVCTWLYVVSIQLYNTTLYV